MTVHTEWFSSTDTGVYTFPPECVIGEHKADGVPLVISNGDSVTVLDVTLRGAETVALLRRAADKLERLLP